jgi:hypothetical protein
MFKCGRIEEWLILEKPMLVDAVFAQIPNCLPKLSDMHQHLGLVFQFFTEFHAVFSGFFLWGKTIIMLLIADRKQSRGCIKRHREEIRDSTARFEYGDSTILILLTGAPCGAFR